MSNLRFSVALLLSLVCGNVSFSQHREYFPDPDPVIRQRLEEWQDLKFGLLMHWGAYSQWGVVESWSICPEDLSWATGARLNHDSTLSWAEYLVKYEQLKTTFNPVRFDPSKWAAAAAAAGMKYVVFTTKHHDGFCMFDSKYTDYKITDKDCPFSSNPRSNVTREIFKSFRAQGLWTGAYFSKPDWHSDYYWWKRFPASDRNCNYSISKYPEQWKRYIDYTHNQLLELVTDYGPVDILWLDGGWVRVKKEEDVKNTLLEVYEGSRWARNPQSQDILMPELVRKVRAKQPRIIVVDRDVPGPFQNYLTPEQQVPDTVLPYPWETCMTMSNSWSHTPRAKYKETVELVRLLIDVVSKGGNFLLNIGPSPEGEFDSLAYDRLNGLSRWIKINGESIYSTRTNGIFNDGPRVRYTQSKDGLIKYVFLFDFPDDSVVLKNLTVSKSTKVSMLGTNQILKWKQSQDQMVIEVPASLKQASEHVWVLKVE